MALMLAICGVRPAAAVSLVLSRDAPECMRHTNEYDGGRVLVAWVSAARLDPAITTGLKKSQRLGAIPASKRIEDEMRDIPDVPEDTRVTMWRVMSPTKRTKINTFRGAEGREEIEAMPKGKYELCFQTVGVEHDLFDVLKPVAVTVLRLLLCRYRASPTPASVLLS